MILHSVCILEIFVLDANSIFNESYDMTLFSFRNSIQFAVCLLTSGYTVSSLKPNTTFICLLIKVKQSM